MTDGSAKTEGLHPIPTKEPHLSDVCFESMSRWRHQKRFLLALMIVLHCPSLTNLLQVDLNNVTLADSDSKELIQTEKDLFGLRKIDSN